MLDVRAFDGRARVAAWTPASGGTVTSPTLVWPETSLAAPPSWVQATIGTGPAAAAASGKVRITSAGTWFYPVEAPAGAPLVVEPPQPAPTTKVQTLLVGDELAVFHDAAGWAGNPKSLVGALIEARLAATAGRVLWAPGLGTPQDYALWAYLGVDLFDASPLLLAAARGEALTPDGPLPAKDAVAIFGATLAAAGMTPTFAQLVAFNLEQAREELARIHLHIERGTLRGLVERRIYAKASSVEVLRRFDREHGYLEAAAPHHRTVALPAMTSDAVWMPEVEAFRRRFASDSGYTPPTVPILLLLPCSQGKPYKMSRSHRVFIRALEESGMRPLVHEVMVTSPLGLVPREVEECYPANQYDIPVTGHWMADEEEVVRTQLAALVEKGKYAHVVVHAGQGTFDALRDLLPPDTTRHTCLKHPTSPEDIARLKDELLRLQAIVGKPEGHYKAAARDRKLEDMKGLLSFQFGAAVAAAMTKDATTSGRMPFLKVEQGDVQVGQTTPERGVVSLTLHGARILAAHGTKRVLIGDFTPKKTSSLFAVGVVGADPDVRIGDDVAIVKGATWHPAKPAATTAPSPDVHGALPGAGPGAWVGGDVVGVGVAQMPASDMAHLKRGVAVTIRHLASDTKGPAQTPAGSRPEARATPSGGAFGKEVAT